jgi:hypothetical protein
MECSTSAHSLPDAIRQELDRYRVARLAADVPAAWRSLERAHILSQFMLGQHLRVHLLMFGYALHCRDWKEAAGQVARLMLAPLGALTGRTPVGNTGRSNVSAFGAMPIPEDLAVLLSAARAD